MAEIKISLPKITVVAGHYGSGKTNIAVNLALMLKRQGESVCIADLDIVNPYFRTKDASDILKEEGIRLISSEFANTNVDTPALPAEAYSAFTGKQYALIDVGGDDRGALALGRYTPLIKEKGGYEALFVINKSRPLTSDAQSTFEIMREIENASKLEFTGIVNNTCLGEETTAQTLLSSLDYAREVEGLTGLKVKYTTVVSSLYDQLKDKIENLLPIDLYVRQTWLH